MKLGEALTLRARQGQQLKDLRARIEANAQIEQGQDAPESVEQLVHAYERLSRDHRDLVYRIHLTNATTDVDGFPLLKLLQERDDLIRRRNLWQFVADAATPKRDRFYGGGEKTYLPAVTVTTYRLQVEEENDNIRVLDAQIQQINWQTDLL